MQHVTVTKLIHNTLMVTCHKSHSLYHKNLTAKENKATAREGVSYAPLAAIFRYDIHTPPAVLPPPRKGTGGLSQQHFLPIRVQW